MDILYIMYVSSSVSPISRSPCVVLFLNLGSCMGEIHPRLEVNAFALVQTRSYRYELSRSCKHRESISKPKMFHWLFTLFWGLRLRLDSRIELKWSRNIQATTVYSSGSHFLLFASVLYKSQIAVAGLSIIWGKLSTMIFDSSKVWEGRCFQPMCFSSSSFRQTIQTGSSIQLLGGW